MTPKPILVTGGAGYIGSHISLELLRAGYHPVILDNFSNASRAAPARISALGKHDIAVIEADVRDADQVANAFDRHKFAAVIHLAGLKSVADSVAQPDLYSKVNLGGARTVVAAMLRAGVPYFVFSSSATVYGAPDVVPVPETAPLRPANPYGETKLHVEAHLAETARQNPGFLPISLRYFNPVGADASGQIGEDPLGPPNNLFPFIAQTAVGRREALRIFGDDYDTPDGTGIRDYIHVSDLAAGHVAALGHMQQGRHPGGHNLILNLGRGEGISVRQVIAAFERCSGQSIPVRICPRREGDVACYYADPALANEVLGWSARRDLDTMCRDTWTWQSNNPQGYDT